MSDRDTVGGSAFPPGSFGDAMSGLDPATGAQRGSTEGATLGTGLGTQTAGSFDRADQSSGGWDQGQDQGGAGSTVDKAKDVAGQAQEKATQAVDTAKEKAGQAADQATTKVDAGMDKAAGGLETLAGTLRERGESMGGSGGTASAVQTAATTAAGTLDSAAQYLREKDTDQLMADLEALVREKPVQSLLVAAGVGFLLSKALR